jgi:hypothetical protein
MRELCKIIGAGSEKVSGDPGTCFCLSSEIAKMEHNHGHWRGSRALLFALDQKLNK